MQSIEVVPIYFIINIYVNRGVIFLDNSKHDSVLLYPKLFF